MQMTNQLVIVKLLITSTKYPSGLDIKLPNLLSRLLAFPLVEINLPTDDVLKGLFVKLLLDRGLKVDKIVIKYMISRIERTYEAVNKLVKIIDNKSLEENRSITIPLVKEAISLLE